MSDSGKRGDDGWEDLVERHLRAELNEAEQKRLAELLDSDESFRRDFVRQATWDTELTEVIRGANASRSELEKPLVDIEEGKQRRATRVLRALLAVAAMAILALSVLLFNEKSEPNVSAAGDSDATSRASIAQISGLSGSLIWTRDRGEIVRDISVGTELAGGTIEGLSPDSWFELQFLDGSQVTISGASLLTFSDEGQKRLRLREGRMSADVTPQPDTKPMIIQTRTATLTVLGTSFDVEAELPATTVNVREGTVRVTRTSDGKAIDVPAKYRVIATADQELERQEVSGYVHQWKSRLGHGPDETFGKWIAATDTHPALLGAVAFEPKEAPNVVLYLLGLGVRSEDGSPVQVNADSRFEIQGEIDLDTEIYFGIQVAYSDGDFAGKFLVKCDVERDDSGGFVAGANLGDFGLDPSVAAYKDKLAHSPEGLFVNGAWCFTHSESPSGLRVSEIQMGLHRR